MTNLRLAIRLAVRQPMISALAVVALALGIGLSTLMFSILNGAVLRGLPFERSERILHVSPFDIAGERRLRGHAVGVRRMAGPADLVRGADGVLHGATPTSSGPTARPSATAAPGSRPTRFRMLRTRPVLGRDFADADGAPGAEPVVIISDRVWRDRLRRAGPTCWGSRCASTAPSMTVVGVMPPGFAYPVVQELWVALAVNPALEGKDTRPTVEIIGRLRDDVDARPGVGRTGDDRGAGRRSSIRSAASGITVEVKPYVEEFIGTETVNLLSVMLAAVLLVLVIACVNVANLVLARAADRTREVAVRTALGAPRSQVIRQTLTEVLVLAVAGAAGGVGIAVCRRAAVHPRHRRHHAAVLDRRAPRRHGAALRHRRHGAGGARGRAGAGAARLARRRRCRS